VTEWSVNRIRGHAPTIRAMHGSDGNLVLMDEVARMPNVEGVYKRATRMLPDAGGMLAMMSTHNGAGSFFSQCCDGAEELGLRRMRWNWRVDPTRDDAWYASELSKAIAAGMEAEFHEEMDLTVRVSADELFDLRGMAAKASDVQWVGPERQVGHSYLKAFDLHQSSRAGSAKTVCYVMDTTLRPGQVVMKAELKVKAGGDETVTQQKLAFIAKWDAAYPGDTYMDITNDKATAELAQCKGRKFGFRFTSDSLKPKREWDATGKMWLVSASRRAVQSNAVGMTGTGAVVAHLNQFPELEIGLRSAHDSEPGQHNAKMRQGGRCVDDLDCFLMLCWALRGASAYDEDRPARAPAPKHEEQGRKLYAPRFAYQLKRVF
jgi:phage FluMu gp28-like protein